MNNRKKQIKYYLDILKEDEILLLKSSDVYFKNHYSSSPLAVLTGFLGSEGEATIDSSGKITIFVDTKYHLLVDKQIFEDVEVYKLAFGETFFEAFKKRYKKNTVLYVCPDIPLNDYLKYDTYFDLRQYELKKFFSKNNDFNKKAKIFQVDKNIEKLSFKEKIFKLQKSHPKTSQMFVFDLDLISYLTNLRSYQMKYSSNFRAILYVDFNNSNHVLFCDKISSKIKIDGLKFMPLDEFESFAKSIEGVVGVDIEDISVKNFVSIKQAEELKNNNLSLLASIRSKSTIEELSKSFAKLDLAILNFRKRIKFGLSEFELSQIIEEEIFKQGAFDLSFKTILAIGENSASIHYSTPSKDKFLGEESIILLDCGAYFNCGYATDITRTFYFGKNPKPIYKKIYTNVLKAFLACYSSNEIEAKKIDEIAREVLNPFEKEGFYFAHGLGHGIGTSVHQNPPVLNMKSMDLIKPYQVHSIEPGLYGKSFDGDEFGVRIENCVYSDFNFKKISLSKFPFEEVLIDYSLLNSKEVELTKSWQGLI